VVNDEQSILVSTGEMKMSSILNEVCPEQYKGRLTLKNGWEVFLRPILPSDESLILDLASRLSSDSLYLRFLSHINALPDDLLFQLTHVNYESGFALAAVIREGEKEAIIAVARYVYDPKENVTDFAIVVRDDWQHYGLGKFLLAKIFTIGKEQHGISRFASIIDPANHIMKRIFREHGYTVKYFYKSGFTEVEVFV
jgi:acetyltransferase